MVADWLCKRVMKKSREKRINIFLSSDFMMLMCGDFNEEVKCEATKW